MTTDIHETFGEPVWDIAKLFPAQGAWSEEEYLSLPGNHLVEFTKGALDILPMPTYAHQLLVAFLYRNLMSYIDKNPLGRVIFAPLRVKLWEGKFREPDIVFMLAGNAHRIHNQYWDGADLVMEVISPDDPKRDTEIKYREYAQAGIAEYWLVNPINETVTLFTLNGVLSRQNTLNAADATYTTQAVYSRGETAVSVLLDQFTVKVDQLFTEIEEQD